MVSCLDMDRRGGNLTGHGQIIMMVYPLDMGRIVDVLTWIGEVTMAF